MPKPLEGGIAKLVAKELVKAGMSKPAVLTKVTPGTRNPAAVSAGINPTTTTHTAQGIPESTQRMLAAGTLISGVDRVIRLFAATIQGGVTPAPGDRVEMEGTTSTVVAGGVSRDPASACFVLQCKS